jgi:hypothetical protein
MVSSTQSTHESPDPSRKGNQETRSVGLDIQASPLLSEMEIAAYQQRIKDINEAAGGHAGSSDPNRQMLRLEVSTEIGRRVAERADEFLDGLMVIVGQRPQVQAWSGSGSQLFHAVFATSHMSETIAEIARHDTPENRRDLHTILKALSETPKSWGRSAFVRFLRNQGEQSKEKYSKYYGQGMLAKEYGWTGPQVTGVCELIMAGRDDGYQVTYGSFSSVLNSFVDVESEIRQDDPDFDNTDYSAIFKASRANKNTALLETLLQKLEERGLADPPQPKEEKPKATRTPVAFEPGKIIRKGNLKDMPLPAKVRVTLEVKDDFKDKEWRKEEVTWVVTERLIGSGAFRCFRAGPETADPKAQKAYASDGYRSGEPNEFLYGAEYLGPYEGKLDNKPKLQYKFSDYRYQGRGY